MNDELQKNAERYLEKYKWKQVYGYAINNNALENEEDFEESNETFLEGDSLEEAMDGYYRKTNWYTDENNDYPIEFSLFDAVQSIENNNDESFEEFCNEKK